MTFGRHEQTEGRREGERVEEKGSEGGGGTLQELRRAELFVFQPDISRRSCPESCRG